MNVIFCMDPYVNAHNIVYIYYCPLHCTITHIIIKSLTYKKHMSDCYLLSDHTVSPITVICGC